MKKDTRSRVFVGFARLAMLGIASMSLGCVDPPSEAPADASIEGGAADADATLDASIDADGMVTDALGEPSPDGGGLCPRCAPGEGCVMAEVVRVERTDAQPWEWGGSPAPMLDGVGMLIVSVVQRTEGEGERVLVRETVADADMRPREASYPVDLGCVPSGTEVILTAFLDDDLNALESEWTSSSFGDACMNTPRVLGCTLLPGEMMTARLALSSQCYHVFDFPDSSMCRR